jgi:hypothetical protein
MKQKFYLFICVLISALFTVSSCEDNLGNRRTARIHITVKDRSEHLENETVYMFESRHAPESLFFKPFYADGNAVSDSYGEVTFDVEFHDDDAMYYFAVFDRNEHYIEYVAVTVEDGDTKSVELNLSGVLHGYYMLKSVVSQTLMTVHGLNYTGDANNRNFLSVKLPVNTERYFYAVSTSSQPNVAPNLRFYDALSRCVDPEYGVNSDALSSLYVPAGDIDCNIFLIKDNPNLDVFCDKSGSFEYFTDASRMNINNGIVNIDEPVADGALWYLGLENPAPDNDIFITIEVCALVWVEE